MGKNGGNMKKFSVKGMTCASCVARVENAVKKIKGVESCAVSLLTESMTVSGSFSEEDIIQAVEKAGYTVKDDNGSLPQKEDDKDTKKMKTRLFSSVILLIVLMYLSMGHVMWGFPLPLFLSSSPLTLVLVQLFLTIIILLINHKFFINGYKSLFHLSPNMDTLVALSSTAAFVYSVINLFAMVVYIEGGDAESAVKLLHDMYFETSAMIVTLITIGKTLETYSKGKTTSALKSLMALSPKTAILLVDGKEVEVPQESVKVGDIFVLRPGAQIPVDGEVIKGAGAVNESMLTGESIPIDKEIGSTVSSGTINLTGYMECVATRVGENTTLSNIIKLVEDASSTKAPIARLADKVSGVFVPAVMGISLLTFIVWLIVGSEIGYGLSRAISVLVISCPCALGLATPVAIVVGSGKGAKSGILYKTAESLELAGKIDIVALDKTGTITEGKPEVQEVVEYDKELLSVAYSLEYKSAHPLSRAVVEYGEKKGVKLLEVQEFENLAGLGIQGKLDNSTLIAGNQKLIEKFVKLSPEQTKTADDFAKTGKTPLFFVKDTTLLGIIAVADKIKEEAKQAVQELKNMGVKVVMITGDNKAVANSVAERVGIDTVLAEVLPSDKEKAVRELKKTGVVAMVGDGINDAPALTSADVGIAIGAGEDVAVDSASIVLIKSRLNFVPATVRLGRRTLRGIKQNLFWAFIYNVIGIPLATGMFIPILGFALNPMIGAAAMSLSSVCVVTNALRLNLIDPFDPRHDKKKKKTRKEIKQMKKVMTIDGMMCMHCEARVKKTLEALDGVTSVEMSLENKTATLTLSKDIPNDDLISAITKEGYEVISID